MPRCRRPASKPAGYIRGVITVSRSDVPMGRGDQSRKPRLGVAAIEGDHPQRRP
jgi:hypothetical protein